MNTKKKQLTNKQFISKVIENHVKQDVLRERMDKAEVAYDKRVQMNEKFIQSNIPDTLDNGKYLVGDKVIEVYKSTLRSNVEITIRNKPTYKKV